MKVAVKSCFLVLSCFVACMTSSAQESAATGDLAVTVKNEDGQPVAGATVHCVPERSGSLRKEPLRPEEIGKTDENGVCLFKNLPGDQAYLLRGFHGPAGGWRRGFVGQGQGKMEIPLSVELTYEGVVQDSKGEPLPGVLVLKDCALPVAVSDKGGRFAVPNVRRGRIPQLSLWHEEYGWKPLFGELESKGAVITLDKGVSVSVRVVLPDGKAAEGARVRFGGNRVERTGEDGLLRDLVLMSGGLWDFNVSYRSGDEQYRGDLRAKLEADGKNDLLVTLEPHFKATLRGKVVMKGTGKPARATILQVREHQDFDCPKRAARTKEDGTFEVASVEPGRYLFAALPDRPTDSIVDAPIKLDVKSGQVIEDLVFKVAEGCAIRGKVVDHMGAPVSGRWVTTDPKTRIFNDSATDEQGVFFAKHLDQPNGKYTLQVQTGAGTTVSVQVEPAGVGKIAENVVIRLPAEVAEGPATVRGVVVDRAGKPVVNAAVWLKPSAQGGHGSTDAQGGFKITVRKAGTFDVTVNQESRLGGGARFNTACAMIGGGEITVVPGQVMEGVRVVVKRPKVCRGRVVDEDGTTIRKSFISIIPRGGDVMAHNGVFYLRKKPTGPFLIECRAPGYQARVFEYGRDLMEKDEEQIITLKKGPYPSGVSVFAEVTGRPATEEAVAAMPHSRRVRMQEHMYRYFAEGPVKQPPSERKPTAATRAELRIRVSDPQGKAIKRIWVEAIDNRNGFNWTGPRLETALPHPDLPETMLDGKDGVFAVQRGGVLIHGEGTARALVVHKGEVPAEPIPVTLHAPSTLTIRVTDYDGKPQKGAVACYPEMVWQHQTNNFSGLPSTNEEGVLTFDRMPPGVYTYRVVLPQKPGGGRIWDPFVALLPVVFKVGAGKDYSESVMLGKPKRGSTDALLESWRAAYKDRFPINSRSLPERPSDDERQRMGKQIAEGLGFFSGVLLSEVRDVRILAQIVEELDLKAPVQPLIALLSRWNCERGYHGYYRSEASFAMVSAFAKLAGDDAVPTFVHLVWDSSRPYVVRRDAVMGLGMIGSDRSVAAFRMLRDAAFENPGAPEPRTECTHAQKICEAAEMTCGVIAGPAGGGGEKWGGGGVKVFDGYHTGEVSFRGGDCSVILQVRRLGDEWLVVGIGYMDCL